MATHIQLSRIPAAPPLYAQLAAVVADAIKGSEFKPGEMLPSENALASQHGLSRATVIKAFDVLAEQRLVIRKQGRGTFVAGPHMMRRLPELTSFSEHVTSLGLDPGHKLLGFETLAAGRARPGELPFGTDTDLVQIDRLRTVGGRPVGLQRVFIERETAGAAGISYEVAAAPDFSLYASLDRAGIHLATATESLRAINASHADAVSLGVDDRTALVEVTRASHDSAGRAIELVRARYLGSMYTYQIHLERPQPGDSHESKNQTARGDGGAVRPAAGRVSVR